ncbi:MAG: YkgJ family cysteine cluster protein [Desulfobacterales bacterium]|jgi:Fe-S-cluster containining protein
MENDMIPLAGEDRFQFACGPGVPCFNACCRDLNQFLTPYDIYRLKSRLKLSSREFLSRYTVTHLGPQTGLPVISLKAVPDDDLKCPFVSETGCGVYEDRPSSCRTYPLVRAITRSRDSGAVTEHFALMREDHCCGCDQVRTQTVREWIEDQELDLFNRFNDMLMEIISIKNQRHPAPLDFREQRVFHLALYDLDGFRQHLQDHGLPEGFSMSPEAWSELLEDDVQLLTFGHQWLKWTLFAEGSSA